MCFYDRRPSGGPCAADDDYLSCATPGCKNKIHLGDKYYDDGKEEVFCLECLRELPVLDLIELLGCKLNTFGMD